MDLKIRYEKCLINLKIVSKLYQHERLRFGHEHVRIMPYTFFSGWIRYFSGENRNDIIIGLNNMFNEIETICDEYNVKHIHYLSVDVEGAELAVIKSINFDKVFIDIIDFENNYEDASVPIVAYLISKNYIMIHKSNDIFMVHKDSIFCKNIFKYNV